jgi:UDP-N-acetyl-D-galactosamine dehydrogenase
MNKIRIAVIGLGYVGLPLAVEFSKKYPVVGFDVNNVRIQELREFLDKTLEVGNPELQDVIKKSLADCNTQGLFCSNSINDIMDCNYFIITVPTPVDKNNRPNLDPLYKASETVGRVLKKNDIVIYESTVYPGVTEEECVPVLEKISGLKYNNDFYCGYSPERINPGDKQHTVSLIKKITSGSTPAAAQKVNNLYKSIIIAGTHLAPSIKVAESAKVIENAQRDINIAFINELAKIFNLLGVDTNDVLEAAATKWNFLKFRPGLVGGHCIGVDPYYLAQKAQELGYHPEIILAGRRLNDGMGAYVANEVIKLMIKKDIHVKNSNILILGITFKENCPDVRNTKVVDIVSQLKEYGTQVTVYDPWADPSEVDREYKIKTVSDLSENSQKFDVIILAVAHEQFRVLSINNLVNRDHIIYDVKQFLPKDLIDSRL